MDTRSQPIGPELRGQKRIAVWRFNASPIMVERNSILSPNS
jgi:hypothetical protein